MQSVRVECVATRTLTQSLSDVGKLHGPGSEDWQRGVDKDRHSKCVKSLRIAFLAISLRQLLTSL